MTQPRFTIGVQCYDRDVDDLRKVITCLRRQTVQDFECIITWKTGTYDTIKRNEVDSFTIDFPQAQNKVYITDPNPTMGSVERYNALHHATSPYIAWVSADNLVFDDFVAQHLANFETRCDISIVNTDYWTTRGFAGQFPRAVEFQCIDLLNFAMTTELARRIEAFAVRDALIYESDWSVLDRAIKSGAKLMWKRGARCCAAHF